ncbi:protein KHNYN [Corythoichthys intestinalis]|uniref:protein KHNYN n=1 Tax=Corythoichthys intestinalis TaxID=161448 RepID=UPI0025A59E4A|nr:protein KHNYN [Corythoichthys intestinalis]
MDKQSKVGDEFVCPEALWGPLSNQQDMVERIFRVSVTNSAGDVPHGRGGQIWVQLRGSDRDVKAAKIFVRGLVKPEEQQEMSYPAVLNCIFCGAKGFFMDCMIKSTSAYIVVGSPGFLLISGLAEPVVRAYSLIADLLERYKGGHTEEQGSDELSPRAFKALVEKWQDRHILDLLLLPRSVKESLLDLVKELGFESNLMPVQVSKVPGMTSVAPEDQAEVGREEGPKQVAIQKDDKVQKLSAANKDFWHLLKFFTAMGYTEEVVKRVLGRTGPKEASQILDLVQQEQDNSDGNHQRVRDSPCETDDETVGAGGGRGVRDVPGEVGERLGVSAEEDDDFVMGVLKKAAVSCGYMEHNVAKACSKLPDGSTHLLLLELQKEANAGMEGLKEGQKARMTEDDETRGTHRGKQNMKGSENANQTEHSVNLDLLCTNDILTHLPPDPLKGLPAPMIPSQSLPQSPSRSKQALQDQRSPTRPRENGNVVVTGKQRFLEGLQTPFELQLTDRPGNPNLRTIIIDGSNVAMSHGLCQFFSCRGIALAVQYFWGRGHREISVLLPQWRQKSDPRNREQRYLDELEKLGLLSYTPSREVQGARISSYDDRFMLQLAQRTGGVIVTKDNMRDLLKESAQWRDIIKKRLLQYTFVGDHFMVPDDPLGRGGPHLDDFLLSDKR